MAFKSQPGRLCYERASAIAFGIATTQSDWPIDISPAHDQDEELEEVPAVLRQGWIDPKYFTMELVMYVVAVTIFVKPQFIEPFKQATLENARNTRQEPMNVRFDVLQAEEDPARFLLYEAYHSKEGFTHHQTTAHYRKWKSDVTDWMAQPRQGVKHHSIYFGE